jgi:cytochrome b6-f complex iron-sulfur subunit
MLSLAPGDCLLGSNGVAKSAMNDRTLDKMPRRQFLMTTSAAACAWGVAACTHTNAARILSPTSTAGAVHLKIADLTELANVGGAIKLKPSGVSDTILLWRSGPSEYAATSITCTHLGCEVEVADAGKSLACPCHGSQFNPDGSVRHGPASRPLQRYVVEMSADQTELTIHLS